MKKLILAVCVVGLFGCQAVENLDYRTRRLEAQTVALTEDAGHLISVVNLNSGTLTCGTLTSGTLVTPTVPNLPPPPAISKPTERIGEALEATSKVVQPLVPLLPAGIGIGLVALLSTLSGVFKKKV
jgi:hypothetical protein